MSDIDKQGGAQDEKDPASSVNDVYLTSDRSRALLDEAPPIDWSPEEWAGDGLRHR